MNRKTILLLVSVLFATLQRAKGQTYYDDGGTHNLNSSLPVGTVELSQQTTLNVLPGSNIVGATSGAASYNYGISASQSTLNIFGGTILGSTNTSSINENGCWAFGVSAFQSAVNIYGGTVTGANSNANSCWATGISADSNSTVNIYGGTVVGANSNNGWAADVQASSSSTVNIQGGTFTGGSGLDDFQVFDGGTLNFYRGNFDFGTGIQDYDNGAANIYGGTFRGGGDLQLLPNGTMNIYGRGFNYPVGPISSLSGAITGTLSDGSSFDLAFTQSSGGEIILLPVPEPATGLLLLLTGAGLLLHRRRKLLA
jgi:hypothetical protein